MKTHLKTLTLIAACVVLAPHTKTEWSLCSNACPIKRPSLRACESTFPSPPKSTNPLHDLTDILPKATYFSHNHARKLNHRAKTHRTSAHTQPHRG